MIQVVRKEVTSHDECNTCAGVCKGDVLFEVTMSRSADTNRRLMYMCVDCISEFQTQLLWAAVGQEGP